MMLSGNTSALPGGALQVWAAAAGFGPFQVLTIAPDYVLNIKLMPGFTGG